MDDVLSNKAAVIERCIARVREEYAGDDRNLTADQRRRPSLPDPARAMSDFAQKRPAS